MSSRWIGALLGLMAGSTFEMFDLYGMTIPSCDELVKVFPSGDLTVHVDDICLADEEETKEALMEVIVTAAQQLARSLREDGLEIALPKCFTLGSTKEMADGIASSLGVTGGVAGTSVRRLGFDHSLAPRRKQLSVRKVRVSTHRKRQSWIWQVVKSAKVKVSPYRIHITGCLPGLLCEAE